MGSLSILMRLGLWRVQAEPESCCIRRDGACGKVQTIHTHMSTVSGVCRNVSPREHEAATYHRSDLFARPPRLLRGGQSRQKAARVLGRGQVQIPTTRGRRQCSASCEKGTGANANEFGTRAKPVISPRSKPVTALRNRRRRRHCKNRKNNAGGQLTASNSFIVWD